jgi:hypothetical protein
MALPRVAAVFIAPRSKSLLQSFECKKEHRMNKPPVIDLKDYRQPVVTSLGIIIGFLLGFLGQWVTEESFALKTASDTLTFLGSVLGVILLLIALFRMLAPRESTDAAVMAYRNTLKLYAVGVILPLASMLISAFI